MNNFIMYTGGVNWNARWLGKEKRESERLTNLTVETSPHQSINNLI